MTQEKKDILLKHLCMALPYEVKIQVEGLERDIIKDKGIRTLASVLPLRNAVEYDNHGAYFGVNIEQVKPYLRPMSSMTDEEEKEYQYITERWMYDADYSIADSIEWLLKKHFDFMGLIPMGLAIEVTEENNPYKD